MVTRRGLSSLLLLGIATLAGCTGSEDTPDAAVSPDLATPMVAPPDLSTDPPVEHDLSVAPVLDLAQPDLTTPVVGPASFALDDHFAASGYMGDGEQGKIKDEEICATTRPGQAMGKCHQFTW